MACSSIRINFESNSDQLLPSRTYEVSIEIRNDLTGYLHDAISCKRCVNECVENLKFAYHDIIGLCTTYWKENTLQISMLELTGNVSGLHIIARGADVQVDFANRDTPLHGVTGIARSLCVTKGNNPVSEDSFFVCYMPQSQAVSLFPWLSVKNIPVPLNSTDNIETEEETVSSVDDIFLQDEPAKVNIPGR